MSCKRLIRIDPATLAIIFAPISAAFSLIAVFCFLMAILTGGVQAVESGPCHIGTSASETIDDTIGFNCMTGNAGNDTLIGRGFGDEIDGALVRAVYRSDSGVDQMFGGSERDVFYPGPHRRIGSHVGAVDVIRDFQSGETICAPFRIVASRRLVAGSHTYIVVKTSGGSEHVIALVLNMASQRATIGRCSILD